MFILKSNNAKKQFLTSKYLKETALCNFGSIIFISFERYIRLIIEKLIPEESSITSNVVLFSSS